MPSFRDRQIIQAPTAATFAAVPIDLGMATAFDVVLSVASGATATFEITDADGIDISGGVTLAGLTASARLSYPPGAYNGRTIQVACTSYSGTGDVAAYLETIE